DALTWSVTAAGNGAADIAAAGASATVTYAPNPGYSGTDSFTARVTDGALTDTIMISVSVSARNDPPEIAEGDAVTVTMDEDGAPTPFGLTLNASDPDGDALTWSVTAAGNGVADIAVAGASATVTYTPNPGYSGTDSFTARVTDGALTDTIIISVSVSARNDPPEIAEGDAVTVTMDEDGAPTPFELSLNAADPDGDALTWSVTAAGNGAADIAAAGASATVTYAPNPGYSGTDSFTAQVTDGALTDTIIISVSVSARNDPPEIAEGDAVTVTMDEDGDPFELTLNAVDPDGDALYWNITASAENGSAYVGSTGSSQVVDYIPNDDHVGTDSFEIQVSDGSLTDTITVYVNIISQAEKTCDMICEQVDGKCGTVYMDEDGSPRDFELNLNATDPDGDVLTWSISTAAENGTAYTEGTGYTRDISYVPYADYNGTDNFEVQVSDGWLTDSIIIYVCIAPWNDTPAFISTPEETVVQGMAYTYSITVDDPDADDTWAITAPEIPDWLELADNGNATGTLAGIPEDMGTYNIRLRVEDSEGETDVQSFTVTVVENPDKPPATDTPVADTPVADTPVADTPVADNGPVDIPAGKESVAVEEDSYMISGDMDGNEIIELNDAILGLQLLSGVTPALPLFITADINDDDKLGMEEVVYILQIISGLK
ncbi:Ig-like domain-containing protein, partial [Desulfobacterales bacterium HSG2]|nr:Ig-like domain-containing protein [Desulfobacterales bacterium HSG2]